MMSPLLKKLPNIITASRLFFAIGFLVLLEWSRRQIPGDPTLITDSVRTCLTWSFVLFVTGGVTDVIDGPLARRFKVTSSFGRSFDPLCDKIFIGGGLILLALFGSHLTALKWWMVAVILGREIFVTVVRHLSEYQGRQFGATWAGKLKMFLQSFMIGALIIYIAHCQNKTWAIYVRNISVWTALIFTIFSGLIYLPRMKHLKIRK
jgi:CDP-diacylglycerol--glycerol-3-phosphate 3-phosphatidyltransferase